MTSQPMLPGNAALLAYAVPAVALAALYLPLFTYVTPFYVAERGVEIASIGAAWIAIRLFDAVSDPAMGWLSDRTRSRFGRRRLWLALSVPVICVATWAAFVPPEGAGLGHAVLWLFLLTLGWTMAQTPYAAWGAELAPPGQGRVRVTAWREAMVLVGTVLSTILYFTAGGGGEGLRAVALFVLISLPLAVIVAVWRVPERAAVPVVRLGIAKGARALAENRPFRRLIAAWFVNGAANALPATLFLFFVEHRLQSPDDAGWLVLVYFLSAILGLPVWSWVAGRIGKPRAWGIAMLWACAVFAVALTLGPGDIMAFAAISVLTGLSLGADLALPPAIQADVVDLDTRRTGAERAGLFFALWQVATKAALAVSSGVALMILGLAGFEATAGAVNGETALATLALLYAGAPIVLKLLAVLMMWRFVVEPEVQPA